MKLRWPTRYERTRLGLGALAVAWLLLEEPRNISRDTGMILGVIFFAAYLIAGLLKPLHDSTGEDA